MRNLGEEAVKIFGEESKKFLSKRKMNLKGFPNSFLFRATGESLQILSSWTWKNESGTTLSGGRKGRSKGKSKTAGTPFVDADKSIKLKDSPMETSEMWVHPSVSKYSFIEAAIQRIQVLIGEVLVQVSEDQLVKLMSSEIKCLKRR